MKPSKEEIESCLQLFNGNLTHTAEVLGIPRIKLYRLIKRLKIDPTQTKDKQ